FREDTPLDPTSPYSASKAAADFLVLAYHKTHGLPALITRCSNNYGPYQFPEKLIPVLVANAMEDRTLPIYGDGLNVREWIFADEHSRAVLLALEHGRPGEVYNVGSGHEKTNLEVVREILRLMNKPESLIQFVKDRPGHDRRYSIDCSKICREWNWSSEIEFASGLAATIEWYRTHQDWMREIKDASYLSYYDRMYTRRHNIFSLFGYVTRAKYIPCHLCGTPAPRSPLHPSGLDGPLVEWVNWGLRYVGHRRSALVFGKNAPEETAAKVRAA